MERVSKQLINIIREKRFSFLIVVLLIGGFSSIKAQKIDWNLIQIDSINKIDKTNDSLINPLKLPTYKTNGLVRSVVSSEYYEFQKKDYIKEIVEEYIESEGIKDNGHQSKRFAIVRKDSGFILDEFITESRYYFDEGCGVIKNTAIIGNEKIIDQNIFCIFDSKIPLKPKQIKVISIENSQNRYIEPRSEIRFSDKNEKLVITYKGTYCIESFKFGGLGTIIPLYINVELSVKDSVTNKEEVILQMPHNRFFKIRSMSLANINSDNHYDLIIETENELCIFRLLYLTNIKNGNKQYDYIGKMIVDCDCP